MLRLSRGALLMIQEALVRVPSMLDPLVGQRVMS